MFHVEHPVEFEKILRRLGILLSDVQKDRLKRFVECILDWNRKINLLSRKDEENIWFSHILHSLTPLLYLEWQSGWSVLDLGTGGGFPGVPLAIMREDIRFVLIDSIQKKIHALNDIVPRIGIANVSLLASRAEDVAKLKGHTEAYDAVTARAVAPLVDLVKWSRPLLKRGELAVSWVKTQKRHPARPFLLAMKGGDLTDEIREVKIRRGVKQLEVIDIVFEGSLEIGLEEKKLILIERP